MNVLYYLFFSASLVFLGLIGAGLYEAYALITRKTPTITTLLVMLASANLVLAVMLAIVFVGFNIFLLIDVFGKVGAMLFPH